MKTKIILQTIILVFSLTMINQISNAQTCPVGNVWACRYKGNCTLECNCIDSIHFVNWTLHGHNCGGNFCNCNSKSCWTCGLRLENSGNVEFEDTDFTIYPNPLSNSTTIFFSLEQQEKVSLKIFDIKGRLVITLADKVFDEGDNELVWKADEVNPGIYFLQILTEENLQTEKLIVTK